MFPLSTIFIFCFVVYCLCTQNTGYIWCVKYYKKYYGERYTDELYVNPDINIWNFKRDGKIIYVEYNISTGEIIAREK